MIVDIEKKLDPDLMLKAVLAIEGICYVFPDDPLSDPQHPLHKIVSNIYTIAHIGSQKCPGCGTGLQWQKEILNDTIDSLKAMNICDVEKHLKDESVKESFFESLPTLDCGSDG